ncbi:ABC transporter permease [Labrys monachus]|uniref:Spermidine/putrescine transport system permease protein n=1 Tax=Labrys monachus TaxID=217067 RepID=A0ABU0FPK5_9HYPH|nr:ABC transporter permease subunit [Labrys monachus]MDQ0396302.1 spermidine/putrescine transport system permease protein [Labrys monachus]
MQAHRTRRRLAAFYVVLFFLFLLLPLVVTAGAALNDSAFPSILPWKGFTGHWFAVLFGDGKMWNAALNTLIVAAAVVALAVPIGTAGAILVNGVHPRLRRGLYGLMIAPILMPGIVIGIATFLFWNRFGVAAGLHLSVLGQVSFIASYAMLLVLARLQSFDPALEEAALDLGASHARMVRRVLIPHLRPALIAAALLGFFQSVENFNVTTFTAGGAHTLTTYVYSRTRSGADPSINALALILIVVALVVAVLYETRRRNILRRLVREKEMAGQAERAGKR